MSEKRKRKDPFDDDYEPKGEFVMVGPDGELSDLQMHAELLQEDDLLDAAAEQRKRWAAREKEIAQARAEGWPVSPPEKWQLVADDNGKMVWRKSDTAPDNQK